jgi:hypothetical protein
LDGPQDTRPRLKAVTVKRPAKRSRTGAFNKALGPIDEDVGDFEIKSLFFQFTKTGQRQPGHAGKLARILSIKAPHALVGWT